MAIRELVSVVQYNYDCDKATELHAGMVVARDSNGLTVAADRASHGAGALLGLLADDTARTDNTMIIPDPVGSSYIDSNGNYVANNNGLYVAAKRVLSDYQAENVKNVTNLTAGASGAQTPMRGVGVFQSAGAEFATDQFALAKTADTNASTFADDDFSGGDTFSVNDLLTFGTGDNAGLLVKVVAAQNNGKVVARVNRYDTNAGLLYITTL